MCLASLLTHSDRHKIHYFVSVEGHEYPDLQVGDEVNPRSFFGMEINYVQVTNSFRSFGNVTADTIEH